MRLTPCLNQLSAVSSSTSLLLNFFPPSLADSRSLPVYHVPLPFNDNNISAASEC